MGENVSPATSGAADRELYTVFRDYVIHENDLINNRVGWFIQLHSFLIATYGIIISSLSATFYPVAPASVPAPIPQSILCMSLVGITIVGFSSSLTAHASIGAASEAIGLLVKQWNAIPASQGSHLPGLTGGGSIVVANRGLGLHQRLPYVLLWLWVASLLIPAAFLYISWHGHALCHGAPSDPCAPVLVH